MATLEEFYNAGTIVSVWNGLKSGNNSTNFKKPLEKWFPHMPTTDMDITLARGYKNRNVNMDLCAYDTNARVRGLQPISYETKEIPFFKNSILFTEKDRRNLLMAVKLGAGNQAVMTALSSHMQNVVDVLLNGADVVCERYRAQLLQHGAITISSPDSAISKSSISINYDISGEWHDNNVGAWSTNPSFGSSDALKDIVDVFEAYIDQNGLSPCTMIMSGSTYLSLLNDTKIKDLLDTQKYESIEDVIQKRTKVPVTIQLDNMKYRPDINAPEIPYWEHDVVALVPNSPLGHIMCGQTPVQYDQEYSNVKRDVAVSAENFSVLCRHIDDPVQIETICSACLLPQFDKMDECFVIRPRQ